MKKTFFTIAIAACALCASAQSFTVLTKEGEKVSFNNSEIEHIRFSTDPYVPEAPLTPVSFNSVLKSITPEEGILDLTASPSGVGSFVIEFNEKINLNYDCTSKVRLSTGGEILFEAGIGDPGFMYTGDFISSSSSLTLRYDKNGYITPGIYTLSVPAGMFAQNNGTPVDGTTRAFIIEVPAPAQTTAAAPAAGLVEQFGKVEYKFLNYPVVDMNGLPKATVYKSGEEDPISQWPVSVAADGTVSIDINPAITAAGIYTITIPSGSFNLRTEKNGKVYQSEEVRIVYSIEDQSVELPAPKLGDFYYSDGSWSSVLVDKGDVKPIGVVFYVGLGSDFGDKANYYKVKDGSASMNEFHGYVVALRDASYDENNSNEGVQWSDFNGGTCGCSVSTEDFLGYTNTKTIRSFAGDNFNKDGFAAAWYATDGFDEKYPAPAQSSGWFLPSAKQLKYIYDSVYFKPNGYDAPNVEQSLKELAEYGGEEMYVRDSNYWSSTEYVDAYGVSYRGIYMCFDSASIKPGYTAWLNKNSGLRVRSILAF